jgi:predicted helicase
LLVKNPNSKNEKAQIFYRDIGDYLSREEKLDLVKHYKTITNENIGLKNLEPNEHGDWLQCFPLYYYY